MLEPYQHESTMGGRGKTRKVTIRLTEREYSILDQTARIAGKTTSQLIRQIFIPYFDTLTFFLDIGRVPREYIKKTPDKKDKGKNGV